MSRTVSIRVALRDAAAREQVTVTGQAPGVVREPTSQVQLTAPEPDAVFGPRPAAWLGPDLYSTTIVQFAAGAVRTVAVTGLPCPVGGRSTIATVSGGAGGLGAGGFGRGGGGGGGFGAGAAVLLARVRGGGTGVGAAVVGGAVVGGATVVGAVVAGSVASLVDTGRTTGAAATAVSGARGLLAVAITLTPVDAAATTATATNNGSRYHGRGRCGGRGGGIPGQP